MTLDLQVQMVIEVELVQEVSQVHQVQMVRLVQMDQMVLQVLKGNQDRFVSAFSRNSYYIVICSFYSLYSVLYELLFAQYFGISTYVFLVYVHPN